MAIKGKGKTKNRPPARAPRRAPVAVPTPMMQRRWVQVTAAFLLGAAVVWFLIWLTNGIRDNDAQDAEAAASVDRRRALQGWKELVESEIPKVGAVGTPATPPTIAAELVPTIEALQDGGKDVAALEGLDGRLVDVADALEASELSAAIRDSGAFDTLEANALTNSQERFVDAMRIYASAVRLTLAAADTAGDQRKDMLDEATALAELGASTVAGAWNDYQLGLDTAGLTAGSAVPPAGGIDPGSIPAGAIPSGG